MLTCKNHTPGWRLHKVFHCPFKVINYSETFIVFLRRVHNDSPERAFNLKVAPLRTPLQTWQPQYDSHCSEEYKNHYKPLSFTIVHYYFLHPHPIHTGWNEARLWWEIISSTLKGARFGKLCSTGMEPTVVTFQAVVEEHHQLEQTFELTVLSMRAPRL